MKEKGVGCTFHYVPLHSAPNGQDNARLGSTMQQTDQLSDRLVRLPLYAGLEPRQAEVIEAAHAVLKSLA